MTAAAATKLKFTVNTRMLTKATGLAKCSSFSSSQESTVLDHVLIRIAGDIVRLTSTDEVSATDITLPLSEKVDGAEVAFLVKAHPLADLVALEDGDTLTLVVDLENHSLAAKIQTSDIALPIRDAAEWPDIDDRFEVADDATEHTQQIGKKTFQEMLSYNSFFLSNGQDPALNLVEVRGGFAITGDRTRFGYFKNAELEHLALKIPGDQISSVRKALDYFPDGLVTVIPAEHYELLSAKEGGINIVFGFQKTSNSVPATLDKIPFVDEPNKVYVDRVYLARAMQRLSIAAVKTDPRLTIRIEGEGKSALMYLTVLNEIGQPSTDTVPVNRLKGSEDKVETVMPLNVFSKALKLSDAINVILTFIPDKYLKMIEEFEGTQTFSIFKAITTQGS